MDDTLLESVARHGLLEKLVVHICPEVTNTGEVSLIIIMMIIIIIIIMIIIIIVIIIIIMALKDAIRDFYHLTAPQTVSNTYTQVARLCWPEPHVWVCVSVCVCVSMRELPTM